MDNLEQVIRDTIEQQVKQYIQDNLKRPDIDTLLDIDDVAEILKVNKRWVYKHVADLPFAIKLPGKMWRFSSKRLNKFLKDELQVRELTERIAESQVEIGGRHAKVA